MMIAYLDASAAMKLLFEELESAALMEYLEADTGQTLVASWLLHTEVHCAAHRRGLATSEAMIAVLTLVDLVDLSRGDLIAAGTLAPLRSQDALHLAVAMRLGAEEMITYDHELALAASAAGLRVVSPGADRTRG